MDVAPRPQEKDEEDGRDGVYQRSIDVQRADVALNSVDQEAAFRIFQCLVLVGTHLSAQIKIDVADLVNVHVWNDDALRYKYKFI